MSKHNSGDLCPTGCGGRLRAIGSLKQAEFQRRRLACNKCGHKETSLVPLSSIWQRGKQSA